MNQTIEVIPNPDDRQSNQEALNAEMADISKRVLAHPDVAKAATQQREVKAHHERMKRAASALNTASGRLFERIEQIRAGVRQALIESHADGVQVAPPDIDELNHALVMQR